MEKLHGMKIINHGTMLANDMLNQKIRKSPLTVDVVKTIQSPEILGSEYGLDILRNVVLGSLMEYHAQLRNILLKNGIDIGEFDTDEN